MRIGLRRRTERFDAFLATARELIALWAKYVCFVVALSLVFGPIPQLAGFAFLLTLGLPILLLVLWGEVLDAELDWSDLDEGPW